jgi:hypothetical protein
MFSNSEILSFFDLYLGDSLCEDWLFLGLTYIQVNQTQKGIEIIENQVLSLSLSLFLSLINAQFLLFSQIDDQNRDSNAIAQSTWPPKP